MMTRLGTALALQLLVPTPRYRDAYLRALRAWRAEGLAWHLAVDLEAVERDFAAFVAQKLAEAKPDDPLALPKTQLWAVADGEIVGRIGILHRLTEALSRDGGHIGYDTVPAHRGRGVATEMLRQALPFARGLGLSEVRLTCDDGNLASVRVIEKNGGQRGADHVRGAGLPTKRVYTIALDERHAHHVDDCIARALLHDCDEASDEDEFAYWDVVHALQKLPVEAVWEAVAPLAHHHDPRRRKLVANTLRYLGGRQQPRLDETVALFREMLAVPQTDDVRIALALAFVDLQHLAALELLRPFVDHASAQVRRAAVHGLLPVARHAVAELVRLSRDVDPSVRDWATFGLGSQLPSWADPDYVDDPHRRAALWARHDDEDEATRGEALVGLAAMRDQRALSLIERARAEGASSYAEEAAEAYAGRAPRSPSP